MEESKQDRSEVIDPLEMEDSLRHSLSDVRFMGIRDHHVLRRPDEIISFAKLLMRWRHNSFYIVSYCAGLKGPQPDSNNFNYDMRLRIAKRIAVKTTPIENPEKDASQNTHELIITLADCKQDRSLKTFPLFCNLFNLLYFDTADIEAMEQRFPEIVLTDPLIQNLDPLYTTTKENLNRVAPLTLYYWHCIRGNLGESVNYVDDTQEIRNYMAELKGHLPRHEAWKLNDGIHYPSRKFKEFLELSAESVSPTLPYELPLKFKRSRKNNIDDFKPLAAQLEGMGIDDAKNRARIVYSLFPQLSHGEIGRIFPVTTETKPSKQTDRDRGRWLLGLK